MFFALLLLTISQSADWQPPRRAGVELSPEGQGVWKVVTPGRGETTLESAQQFPARPGDAFEVNVRIRVGINTSALPELACYDAEGREIPAPSSLATGPDFFNTNWQSLRRVFPARPGTVSVRARVRIGGFGEVRLAGLEFRPKEVDTYQTGMLVGQLYPNRRRGLVLESNFGVNAALVSREDRDGDGRWALVHVDLDRISQPEEKGEDWRTNFEYRPNEIYWSDGAVLKSDSVREDRQPDIRKALHFRTRVHEGSYEAILNDPGRAVAVSLDGSTWRRFEGGAEAELGVMEARGGFIELWVDACYRDPVSAGPAYFDYVRLFPADDPRNVARLAEAARQKPPAPARGSVEERRVPVSFTAPAFAGGANWPVRCGLPVPRGELASAANAAVLDAGGKPVPSQARALATWPDGSVKWLYLDFWHDFRNSGEGRYTVAYGNAVRPLKAAAGVTLRTTDEGVEVDTGAVRFLVPKKRFGMIENVRLASGRTVQREPVAVEVTEADGRKWSALALPVEKLELEQAGPLHAVILAETKFPASGKPAEGFAHRARIRAYAGSPLVQVDYFIANTDGRKPAAPGTTGSKLDVRSVALKLKPAGRVVRALHSRGAGEAGGAVVQATAGDAQSAAAGWLALGLEGGSAVHLGVEAFREQFPKAFRWKPEEVEIALWAEEGGNYEWVEGVGKTHRLAFHYGAAAPSAAELMANGPVLALAAPEWYARSGAFGRIGMARESGFSAVEKTLAGFMANVVERVGLGFENYGDHSSPGYVKGTVAWNNNEYDQPAAAIYHFVRTGDRAALRFALASALHYVDVDTCHYSAARLEWAGAARVHGHGVIGHHTAEPPNMHHAGDVQGLIWLTYFTGEPAGLEGARGIARWVLRSIRPAANVGSMERALGHPLMTLTDVYEATWKEEYLAGAARLVDWALKWEHPERSGFLAPITESPGFYSGSPFCGGLLPSALMKFNGWAKLPEIEQMLERVARWTLTDMWRPPANIIHKGGPPRASAGANPRHLSSHFRLMAHVFERTGDPLFLAAPMKSLENGFGERAQTRSLGYRSAGLVFNYMPWFLEAVKDAGSPSADAELEIRGAGEVTAARGERTRACFTVRNAGAAAAEGLKLSFRTRLDIATRALAAAPASLAPGAEFEACFEVEPSGRINLTAEANRIAYGHLTALHRREGKARTAHAWTRLGIVE